MNVVSLPPHFPLFRQPRSVDVAPSKISLRIPAASTGLDFPCGCEFEGGGDGLLDDLVNCAY